MSNINASAAFLTGGGGAPAAKFPVPNTTVTGTIVGDIELMQQREFGTGAPLAWPDGKPKMQLVITLKTPTGEQRVFVKGQMRTAIAAAVKGAGRTQLDPGGSLSVTYVGNGEPARPGISGAKQYSAVYAPPASGQAEVLGTAPAAAGPVNPFPVTAAPAPNPVTVGNPFLTGTVTTPEAQAALAALS
jgi:hypothetical protein